MEKVGIKIPDQYKDSMPAGLQDQIKEGLDSFEMDKGHITTMEIFAKIYGDVEAYMVVFLERLRLGEAQEVTVVALTLFLGMLIAYGLLYALFGPEDRAAKKRRAEEEALANKKPERDFTLEQLRTFDGREEKMPDQTMQPKPLYVGLKRVVYDVSEAEDLYGPDAAYHCFTGREASRAMGKFCMDEAELRNPKYDDLTGMERDILEGYVDKFKYQKDYPVVGRVTFPPTGLMMTRAELRAYSGKPGQEVPAGRVDAPIYMGINGKVIDVSYGGKASYGPGGSYHLFAGIDASRALAKMSFSDEDTGSHDLSDLSEDQRGVLANWESRFIDDKLYPVVGSLADE